MFWFLKKGFVEWWLVLRCSWCSPSVLIRANHLLFTSDPLLGCPPSCSGLVNKSKATTYYTKNLHDQSKINGQNYSFWQSSSHITLQPHSFWMGIRWSIDGFVWGSHFNSSPLLRCSLQKRIFIERTFERWHRTNLDRRLNEVNNWVANICHLSGKSFELFRLMDKSISTTTKDGSSNWKSIKSQHFWIPNPKYYYS